MEAILARGGRTVADALYKAYQNGARFDAWSDMFKWEHYQKAFDECGVDPHFYANRTREHGELMPWSMISRVTNFTRQ